MRTLAVEPPPLLDEEERRVKFINRNGNPALCSGSRGLQLPELKIFVQEAV